MKHIGFNQKLSSQDGREYYITSDLHFYHKGVLSFCPETRPWEDVEEMNSNLIEEWNSIVKPEDVVFHLGDFCFKAKAATLEIMEQLNGKNVWVRGNHDYKVFNQIGGLDAYDYLEIKFDGVKVCMMHYPITAWNQQGRNSVMLHGHTHGSYQGEGRTLDVGWDAHGKILRLEDAVKHCLSKEVYCPDHHKVIKDTTL